MEEEKDNATPAPAPPAADTEKPKPLKSARHFDVEEMMAGILQAKAAQNATAEAEAAAAKIKSEESRQTDPDKDAGDGDSDEDDDDDVIGPMPPPGLMPASSGPDPQKPGTAKSGGTLVKSKVRAPGSDDDEDEDDSSDEVEDVEGDDEGINAEKYFFPTTEQSKLNHGSRPVSALSIDPTGTRFATGSFDYEVKLWDFTGLKNRHAFRSMRPCESHPIRHVSYSLNGDSLLIISGNAQAKVVDRDGTELLECAKGDQYIVDMARTKGHVASLTGGQFNPKQKNMFLTSSDDGTCRLWDVSNPRQHQTCVKMRASSGLKNRATACCFGRDGNTFVGAGFDGTINMWDMRRPLVVPTAVMREAHQKNTDIYNVTYSYSGLQLVSRGEDAVVNVFDTRNFKQKLWKADCYPGKYATTDLCFSPDDKYLLIPSLPVGLSGRTKDESITHTDLHFLSMSDFTHHHEVTFKNEILIRTAWNHRINQIMVTFASGAYCMLYDLHKSTRGALLSHGLKPKKVRTENVMENLTEKMIITPNALPLFKVDKPRNRRREEAKARMDPVKSQRPDLPMTQGSGGRVAAAGSTLSSYVIRNLGLSKSVKDDMDPREAILRFAKDAAENPIWVTPAYKRTQPHAIFQTEDDDETEKKKPKL